MYSVPASQWKRTTSPHIQGRNQQVGIDLFDDESDNEFTIYIRYADGTRSPARSVSLDSGDPNHAETVLRAWAGKGSVNDYRGNKTPAV